MKLFYIRLSLIFCLAFVFCGCQEKRTTIGQKEYAVTNVKLYGNGSNANDYKTGFMPSEQSDGITAYMVFYSVKPLEEVYDYLKSMTAHSLESLDVEKNQAYYITDLSYDDGVGNTLNTDQRDLVTGKKMGDPGTYYFYVATIGEDGVLAIALADRTKVQQPFAYSISVSQMGDAIQGRFLSDGEQKDQRNYIFYSTDCFTMVEKKLKKLKLAQMEQKNLLSFDNQEETEFTFLKSELLDFNDSPYDKNSVYYVYVASFSKKLGFLGLSYDAVNLLLPEELPQALEVIGDGKGTIDPIGGAATLGKGRDSILSISQAIFQKITGPVKIAVIGASSGTEKEIAHYFYEDDNNAKSFKSRFTEAGFVPIYIPLTIENHNVIGESAYYKALINSCASVYFTGGDQSKAMTALTRSDGSLNAIGTAVVSVYERGGILAGSSAGAHILSDICFQEGTSYSILGKTEQPVIYPGIPCGIDGVFDSHFHSRGRLGRLAFVTVKSKKRYGIGIDENTSFAVKDGIGTVYGSGGVTILDFSEASGLSEIRLHYLTAPDQYDFRSHKVIIQRKKAITEKRTFENEQIPFFGENYATTRCLLDFAASDLRTKKFIDQGIKITLTKTKSSMSYEDEKLKYVSINALKDRKKCSITNLILSIQD